MSFSAKSILSTISIEYRIIILSTQSAMDAAAVEDVRQLLELNPDWVKILKAVYDHRVGSLFYSNLQKHFADSLPENVMQSLREAYYVNLMHKLLLKSELVKLLSSFRDSNLPALPLKGVVLAERAYRSLALRDFGDLDILIHHDDFSRCVPLLETLGYSPLQAIDDDITNRKDYTFQNRTNGAHLELHWKLAEKRWGSVGDPEILWSNLQSITVDGLSSPYPAVENEILYLCMHGFRHQWERLSWICDIAHLLASAGEINWQHLLYLADYHKARTMLLVGLGLPHCLWSIPLPQEILSLINSSQQINEIIDTIIKTQFEPDSRAPSLFATATTSLHYQMIDGWANRRTYLKNIFFNVKIRPNQADYDWVRLPARLTGAYYFLRPIRLLVVHGPAYGISRLKFLWSILTNRSQRRR